jgi:glycerol-3-phosphate dehydrogenase
VAALPDNLDPVVAERLARLYGSEAKALVAEGGDVRAEARRAVLIEGAMRLEDVWVRRSGRAWFDDAAGLGSLEPVADEMAALLGWSTVRRDVEIEHCRSIDRISKAQLGRA